MSPSTRRFPFLRGLSYPVGFGPVPSPIRLNLDWSDLRVHDVFNSSPDVPLRLREFLQPVALLVNLELDFCRAKPLPPEKAQVGQPFKSLE